MTQFISRALKTNPGKFASYKMRRAEPEVFFMTVKHQNYIMMNQYVVVLKNICSATLFYLEDRIRAIDGVQEIVEGRLSNGLDAVAQSSISSSIGKTTAASQQYSLLRTTRNNDVSNPRMAFKEDLCKWISKLRKLEHQILIAGDFNETFEDSDALQDIADANDLLDIMHERHSHLGYIPTYARGRQRIDYILGTAQILTPLNKCGYTPFYEHFHTDHRGFFVEIDLKNLFDMITPELVSQSSRGLCSRNITQVTDNHLEKHRLLHEHNAFERANELLKDGDRNAFAEHLDTDILSISLCAENRVTRFRRPYWYSKLA